MSGLPHPLGHALRHFLSVRRGFVARLTFVRFLWVSLALALAFVYFDMLLALPALVRFALDLFFIAALIATIWFTRRRWSKSASAERMVARMVESGNPELGNDLLNAIDFSSRVRPGVAQSVSADLMQAEIDQAVRNAARVRNLQPLRPESLKRDQKSLTVTVLIALFFSFLFFDAIWTIAPRFLNPAGDYPPYSPTQLTIEPAGASVDYGDDLIVRAIARGPQPEAMSLVTERADGTIINELPMFSGGDGNYRQTIEDIREEFTYYVKIPDTRSRKQQLQLTRTPRIESVYASYAPPEYAGQRKLNRVLDEPLVKGLAGTQVTLTLTSNRPLKTGQIQIGDQKVPLAPDSEKSVAGTFTLDQPGEFIATITDVDGFAADQSYKGRIEITPDNKPEIVIVSPGMDSYAIPDAKIPLVIEATDDLGVGRIDLFRAHNGSEDAKKAIYTPQERETFASLIETLDLADLGVKPGDMIDYYATVSDTRPGGANSAASSSFRLMIISKEDYAQFMQSQMTAEDLTEKYNAILEKMEQLADEQEQLRKETEELQKQLGASGEPSPDNAAKAEELKQRQEALASKTAEAAEQLQKSADAPAVFDIEKDYKKELAQMAERLRQASETMKTGAEQLAQAGQQGQDPSAQQQAAQNALASQQQSLDQMGMNTEQFQQGIQQANQDLERMDRLMGNVEEFKYLYSLQSAAERQARSFRENPSPSLDDQVRLKEIAAEQAAIREQLAELKAKFREDAKAVEKDYPKVAQDAKDIADQIEKRAIEQTMSGAEGQLNEGRGREGHEKTRSAKNEMEGMISQCESTGGQGGECEQRLRISMQSKGMNLGNTMEQMGQRFGQGSTMGQGSGQAKGQRNSQGGSTGASQKYGVFGDDEMGRKPTEESSLGRKDAQADHGQAVEPDPLSGNIEELDASKNEDLELGSAGDERFIEEYKPLIEAYFEGLAKEAR